MATTAIVFPGIGPDLAISIDSKKLCFLLRAKLADLIDKHLADGKSLGGKDLPALKPSTLKRKLHSTKPMVPGYRSGDAFKAITVKATKDSVVVEVPDYCVLNQLRDSQWEMFPIDSVVERAIEEALTEYLETMVKLQGGGL